MKKHLLIWTFGMASVALFAQSSEQIPITKAEVLTKVDAQNRSIKIAEQNYILPYTITITRDEENLDELIIDDIEIEDAEGEEINAKGIFKLSHMTLIDEEGYWRETGAFLLNTIANGENEA